MLLSLMVMVVVAHPRKECPAGFVRDSFGLCGDPKVLKGKREALDAPMPHKAKRCEFIVKKLSQLIPNYNMKRKIT